eukprot:Pgem_evm1s5892
MLYSQSWGYSVYLLNLIFRGNTNKKNTGTMFVGTFQFLSQVGANIPQPVYSHSKDALMKLWNRLKRSTNRKKE